MSVKDLLLNKQRLGQAHYLQKVKKAEDELNSAFNRLCKVVADNDIVANLQFDPASKTFAVMLPLKRRINIDGEDTSQGFIDEVLGEGKSQGILVGSPHASKNDVLQISVSEDPTGNIKEDKISVDLTKGEVRKGLNFEITNIYKDPINSDVIKGSGCSDERNYQETYYWVEPEVLKELKLKLVEEVEVLDSVQIYRAWVKDPKVKDARAFNLFQELSELLDVFITTLTTLTSESDQPEAIRRIDGFLLYCQKVGLLQSYETVVQNRLEAFESLKQYFSLESDVVHVKRGLPVVKKYSTFKDIDTFLTWLYSFWGSASNQSFAGRVAALLCSKPKSGTLGKSSTALNSKPTGSKGKGKGKEAPSKKASQDSERKESGPRKRKGMSPPSSKKKGSGKERSYRKKN